MVSSTAISKILAQLTGVPKSKTDSLALELRKAGILKTKGPGRGGIDIDFEEARDMILALLGANVPKDAPATVKKLNSLVDKDGKTFGDTLLDLFSGPTDNLVDCVNVSKTSNHAVIIYSKGCINDPHGETVSIPGYLHFSDPDGVEKSHGYGINSWISGGVIRLVFALLKSPTITQSELDQLNKEAERMAAELKI
ncbi:MAG: hypothetical protein AB7U36_10540 [Desulfobacter sp.]